MALWVIRAGKNGEYENLFISEKRIYLTRNDIDSDLNKFANKSELLSHFLIEHKECNIKAAKNWVGQSWKMACEMKVNDYIILPIYKQKTFAFGIVIGNYSYNPDNVYALRHSRKTEWVCNNIPKLKFEQDLLFSFGAYSSLFNISKNNAEDRVLNIIKEFKSSTI